MDTLTTCTDCSKNIHFKYQNFAYCGIQHLSNVRHGFFEWKKIRNYLAFLTSVQQYIIQRYNGLCELPIYCIVSLSCAIESRISTGGICCVQSSIGKIELMVQITGPGEKNLSKWTH